MVEEQVEHVEQIQEEAAPVENTQEVQQETPQEDKQARNFRELRERNERAERERDEALRRLQEIEQTKIAAQQPEEPDYQLEPDALVEGKHLSKYKKKQEKELASIKKELSDYKKQSIDMAVENKIKSKYTDFDSVVNKDTIASLRETHPEIAESIASNANLYNQAVSAYTMIKNLGIYKDDVNQQEKRLIQENLAKPRSVASISPQQGNSPLSRANAFAEGLTPELKAQLLKEMQQARKSY